jgi:malate dehydrogenase (quinone)
VAATRIVTGTDVDYGSLTNHFIDHLSALPGFVVNYSRRVTDLTREQDGRWQVEVEDAKSGERGAVTTKFVFIGAGGGALPLLQKSGIPEGKGFAGFPVGGLWLRCDDPAPTNATMRRCTEKRPMGRRPCQCRTSTLG